MFRASFRQSHVRPHRLLNLTWVLIGLATSAFGQSAPSQLEILDDFLQERAQIFQEMSALFDAGVTQLELQLWEKQNQGRFDAQRQRAKALGEFSSSRLFRLVEEITIPPDASPTFEAFLC